MKERVSNYFINGKLEKNLVRVRVPIPSASMKAVVEKKAYDSPDLRHYWRGVMCFGRRAQVRMHFYGIREKDLGRKITARVQITEWIEPSCGYLNIRVYKTGGQPTTRMRFFENDAGADSVSIIGTRYYVCFAPIKGRQTEIVAKAKPEKSVYDLHTFHVPTRLPIQQSFWQRILEVLRRFLGIAHSKPALGI